MIDYQVENGKISTIDGYKVGGGDELTGAKLKENIAKSTPYDGMEYSLTTDGTNRLIINAKGRYQYMHKTFSTDFKAPAGNYVIGQTITLDSRVEIDFGYFISMNSTFLSVIPYQPTPRVEGEPVWKIEAIPNSDGSMNVKAMCIKEGTLTAEKNYGTINLEYNYLFYGYYS